MFRLRPKTFDPLDFLAGPGEMAERIRSFDWASHPFGPISDWPQSLRAALSICLHSAFPTAIYWGPELRLLYNDAWAPIPGPRHPDALGRPAKEVWSDIWHVIEPQFAEVVEKGQGLFAEEQMLPMRRHGLVAETWWNYSFTPLRDEDGQISGIFNSGSEITENVIQRRNAEFLVAANNAFRLASTPEEALSQTMGKLGELLKACRVGFRERVIRDGQPAFALTHEWCAPGVDPLDEVVSLRLVGPRLAAHFLAGNAVTIGLRDPDLEPQSRAFMEQYGIAKVAGLPWVENGEVIAVIYVHWSEDHVTSALDISAMERVLETTMGWMERERNRARERIMAGEIDHRARNLLAVVQSVTRMTTGDDVAQVKDNLLDRFSALSRVHGLMGQKRWTDVTLRELIEEELTPYGTDVFAQVGMSGPKVTLTPSEAQMIAMVLHELTTNAVKHGFLNNPDGRLALDWIVEDGELDLTWRETGVSAGDDEAAEGGGYGTRMLAEVIQRHLGGEMHRTVGAGGMRYDLRVPIKAGGSAAPTPDKEDSRRSVMIVEDDVIISMDLAATLEEAGYLRFGEYLNADSALAALEQGKPDLAVLDSDLGGGSSAPVAAWLKANGVPFVVVSGNEAEDEPGDARTGAPRLVKPIAYPELLEVLARL